MGSEAYKDDYIIYECYDGKLIAMSPRPLTYHNNVAKHLYDIFFLKLMDKKCEPYSDGFSVHLFNNDDDYVVPDFFVLCDKGKERVNGIYGAPDLVAEVLSPSTLKRDRVVKMELYAKAGVKEYLILSPDAKSIEQYVLKGNKFELKEAYTLLSDIEIKMLSEDELKEYKTEFSSEVFPNIAISLEYVFNK